MIDFKMQLVGYIIGLAVMSLVFYIEEKIAQREIEEAASHEVPTV